MGTWGDMGEVTNYVTINATSTFISAMAKCCLMQFLPACPHCPHCSVPAECHHPPGRDRELVQLVISGPEASDSHQGIPEPPHSAPRDSLGTGQRAVSLRGHIPWWLHALAASPRCDDIVPDGCLGGIVSPPPRVSLSPFLCSLLPLRPCFPPPAGPKSPRCRGRVLQEVPVSLKVSPCPAGCSHGCSWC